MKLLTIFLLCLATTAMARGTYQEPANFVNDVFDNSPPAASRLWITKPLRNSITKILGHKPDSLRVRYWGEGKKTAWILDEIGKEKPITVGIVVSDNKIKRIKVLIFRESRGWEVRHDFFTNQFKGASLTSAQSLSKPIDGISGATLSVRALTKISRLALYLHQQTPFSHDSP